MYAYVTSHTEYLWRVVNEPKGITYIRQRVGMQPRATCTV